MVELFLARAGEKSLSVHIISSELPISLGSATHTNLIQFLTSIAPRARGVMWDSPGRNKANAPLFPQVISTFLKDCVPGRLTQFSMDLFTADRPLCGEQTLIKHPEAVVEALWLSIDVLELRNFYPKWTSKLYHGLTMLHLHQARWGVPQSALEAILKSSPKLRVLEVGIDVTGTSRAPVTPVILEDLEVFRPTGFRSRDLLTLMSLIQPGQKPLTIEIVNLPQHKKDITFFRHPTPKDFFSRSNVTRLIVSWLGNDRDLFDLLMIAPTVRTLAIECLGSSEIVEDKHLPSTPSTFTLDALYVTRTSNYYLTGKSVKTSKWPLVEQIVRRHSVSKLTLWSYSFDRGVVPDNLYTICSQVTLVSDKDPDPIQGWLR